MISKQRQRNYHCTREQIKYSNKPFLFLSDPIIYNGLGIMGPTQVSPRNNRGSRTSEVQASLCGDAKTPYTSSQASEVRKISFDQ